MAATPEQMTIARLEARVAALEEALEQRSRELRLIQSQVCKRDLIIISRLLAGLPALPLGAYEPAFWRETTGLAMAEVDDTLKDLWSSLIPQQPLAPEAEPDPVAPPSRQASRDPQSSPLPRTSEVGDTPATLAAATPSLNSETAPDAQRDRYAARR
ncbi:MAG: hypothetical protein M3O15_12365 [Acidobacteriota bacterium]|nr:hypothetical protein [Acidobacteriota bacterium]